LALYRDLNGYVSALVRVFEVKFGANKVDEEKEEKVDVAAAGMQRLEIEWEQKMLEVSPEESQLRPFARVDSVESESPAEAAGLQTQDQVLRFGSADASNHRELAAVRDIVQRNVGGSIRVVVRRQEQVLALVLTPQTWRGPGVLGCLLLPM
jgi:C-terminal processing protease CtpA/Prc